MNAHEDDFRLTREEALFWLNATIGQEVAVEVSVQSRDYAACFLHAHGVLSHHGESARRAPSDRGDTAGMYFVGTPENGTVLDLSDVPNHFDWRKGDDGEELHIALDDESDCPALLRVVRLRLIQ